jgi:hypothetical protein
MLIRESDTIVGSLSTHIAVLLALAVVRFLNVCEISIHNPRDVGFDALRRMIANRERCVQPGGRRRIQHTQRQRAMWDTIGIGGHLVAGLSAASASEFLKLRVDVRECQRVRFETGRLTCPRRATVDLQT